MWYDYKRSEKGGKSLEAQTNERIQGLMDAVPQRQSTTLQIDIYRALSLLRDEERTCITLQLIDGYAIDEIAKITDMPTGTVKSHLKRGKEKLANYLRQNGYDR